MQEAITRARAGVAGYVHSTPSSVPHVRGWAVQAARDAWVALRGTTDVPPWVTKKVTTAVEDALGPVAREQALTREDAARVVAAARALPLLHEAHADNRPATCPAYISSEATGEAVALLMEMDEGLDVPGMVAALQRCGQQGNRNVTSVYTALAREAAEANAGGHGTTLSAMDEVLRDLRARKEEN